MNSSTSKGLEITSFILENVSVPPEVEAAIDKRSSMAAVGNLNDYVKFQMAEGMEKGGGAGGIGAEMAVGLAMAQQIVQANQATPGIVAPTPSPATAAATQHSFAELLSPAQAADLLGVSEADVASILASGELKGKKIGSTWRIPKAAVEQFLAS